MALDRTAAGDWANVFKKIFPSTASVCNPRNYDDPCKGVLNWDSALFK
jgi:hypothetical protein